MVAAEVSRRLLCPRLVGREVELATLGHAFADPRSGTVLGVVGEAGIGKSALLRRATQRAGSTTVVIEGRAVENGRPFGTLAELAVGCLAHGADASAASMGQLQPGLASLLSDPGAVGGDADAHPVLVAEALMTLVATMRAPTVLVLDDLHWADPDSLEAIDRVAGRAAARSVSVVLAARPASDADALLARLSARRVADCFVLGPLEPSEVDEMLSACLGAVPPSGLLRALASAGGLPFQIEELLRSAVDADLLSERQDGWSFDGTTALPLPRSITDSVVARLRQLDPTTARILASAAVVGPAVAPALLASGIRVSLSEVDAAVRHGVSAQLLDPEATAITFRHALSEEAAAAYLLPRERVAVAAEVLAVAATAADVEPAALARLARLAEDHPAAAYWHMMASDRLSAVAAVGSALQQLDLALELAEHLDPPTMADIRLRRVELLALVGRADDSLREAVIALAAEGNSQEARGRLLIAQARAATTAAHHTAAAGYIAEAIEATAGGSLFARASATAALLAVDRGDHDAATRHADAALAAGHDDVTAQCQALEVLGRVARGRDLDRAADYFDRESSIAEAHGLKLWRARGLHERATIDQLRSLDIAGLWTARSAAVDAGSPGLVGSIDYHLSAVLTTRFEPEHALEVARNGVHLMRTLSNEALEARWWILVAYAHTVARPELPQPADAALEEAKRLGGDFAEVRALAVVVAEGLRPLLLGDVARAARGYQLSAIELIDNGAAEAPLPPWYFAPVLCTRFETRDAEQVMETARQPALDGSAAVRPNRLLAEAVAAGRQGETGAADALVTEANAIVEAGSGAAGLVHVGRWLVASEAHTAGWGQPVSWLQASEQWAADHGYQAIVDSCRAQLRNWGVTPKRRRSQTPVPAVLARLGITGREIDVLALVGDGRTNKDIAERLHVSPRTVKGHVEHLLAKTASSNRSALASLATQHGLVPPA
jgi:DNA-binding CsgD family transcriptional regulator